MSFDFDAAFREIANGDEAALTCLHTLYLWVHLLDDLIDRDKPVMTAQVVMANLRVLECFATNTFFQRHKAALLPILQSSALTYLDSERLRVSEDVLQRIASQVLKSDYQNFFYAVARCTGGDAHMLKMSVKYRAFDFDPTPAP